MGGGEVTFCEMSQDVICESAAVGGELLLVREMAARPLVRDFSQSPWNRIAQEISGMAVQIVFFFEGAEVGDFFSGAGVGWGLMRWRPAAMAWGQKRPSRWLAGHGHVASSHVAVRAVTEGRKMRLPDFTVPFQPSGVFSESITAPIFMSP